MTATKTTGQRRTTMKRPASLHVTLAALTLTFSLPASHAQQKDLPAVAEHIAIATKAAKTDELGPLGLCKTATPASGPDFMTNYNAMVKKPPLSPMQVMDELYFLGNYWPSAW